MAKKRTMSTEEADDLRHSLQVATLDALMTARRWEPSTLLFQGGTAIHLGFGSPRYSEDIDMLTRESLKLDSLASAVERRLQGTRWLPPDARLVVSAAKPDRNPHAFTVTISGPQVIGSVRVKVELWRTSAEVLEAMQWSVRPVRIARGPASGMQAFVPTLEPEEIYVDKVFALVARPYLKARDVFDLHWLRSQRGQPGCSAVGLRVRLATYPNESAEAWLARAVARREELLTSGPKIAEDLRRWLPSYWRLDEAAVRDMIDQSVAALDQGVEAMREVVAMRELQGPQA